MCIHVIFELCPLVTLFIIFILIFHSFCFCHLTVNSITACKKNVIQRILLPLILILTNFLTTVLSSHCMWDKGRFASPKKASCPGYGARRPLKCKKKKKNRIIAAVHRIVLWFYYHFLIERYEHYTKRITFPIQISI